jgi:hypothetical protein
MRLPNYAHEVIVDSLVVKAKHGIPTSDALQTNQVSEVTTTRHHYHKIINHLKQQEKKPFSLSS